MYVGWLITLDGKKYYFDPNTGIMATGNMIIDGKEHYFIENGKDRGVLIK